MCFKGEQRAIIAPLPQVADLCYVAKLPLKLGSTPLFGRLEIQEAEPVTTALHPEAFLVQFHPLSLNDDTQWMGQ